MRRIIVSLAIVASASFCHAQSNTNLSNFFDKTWYEQPHKSDAVVINFKTEQYQNVPGIDLLQFEEYFTCSFSQDGSFNYKEFDYCPGKKEEGKPLKDGTSTQSMQPGKWKWLDEEQKIMKVKFESGCVWKVWINEMSESDLQLKFKPISNSIQ